MRVTAGLLPLLGVQPPRRARDHLAEPRVYAGPTGGAPLEQRLQ